jgi:hypothetical protein
MDMPVSQQTRRYRFCERRHILGIVDNWYYLTVLMRLDIRETLEHFKVLDTDVTFVCIEIRENRAPNGMRMQHCARAKIASYPHMERAFIRRLESCSV